MQRVDAGSPLTEHEPTSEPLSRGGRGKDRRGESATPLASAGAEGRGQGGVSPASPGPDADGEGAGTRTSRTRKRSGMEVGV